MDKAQIEAGLKENSLFRATLHLLDTVPSTNTRLKELAESGAPEGTVLLAEKQSAGRGTGSRQFFSPGGEGLYLSLLLRPRCTPAELLTLTGRTAAAVRHGIEAVCGAPCAIKWLNDIYLNGRKLCGILTELSPTGADWVVVGIGVNVSQSAAAFAGQGLETIATSLAAEGYAVSREALACSILNEMDNMYRLFPQGLATTVEEYRARCLTIGRRVSFSLNGQMETGFAVDVADDFTLIVENPAGQHRVSAGTVSLL